jgi:hypothetical protein
MRKPWSTRTTPLELWLMEVTLMKWQSPKGLMIERYHHFGSLNRRKADRIWFRLGRCIVRFLNLDLAPKHRRCSF